MSSEGSYLPEFFSPERMGFKMNTLQRSAIALGSSLLIAVSLYPPWTTLIPASPGVFTYSAGYSLIWSPPSIDFVGGHQIDVARLIVEYVAILALTFGLIVVTAPRQRTGSDSADTGLGDSLT